MTNNTTPTQNDQLKGLVARARDLYERASRRHLIVRRQNGQRVFEMNLALAIVIGILVLLFAAWALVLGAVAGYLLKLRVEIVREADDNTIIDGE